MRRIDPVELAAWSGGCWHEGDIPELISGFCFDARQLRAGQCFVALSSGARDGHDFTSQAVQMGASAILVEQLQDLDVPQLVVKDSLCAMASIATGMRRHFSGHVVGITGSCGKTSTKEMLRLLLGETCTHATAGNWNNRIGVPMTLFGLDSEKHDYAVIEAGINQPGEMVALGSMIEADLTVITNVAEAHLELLGSIENIASEKVHLAARAGSLVILPHSAYQYSSFSDLADRSLVLAADGETVYPKARSVIRYRLQPTDLGQTTLYLSDGAADVSFVVSSLSDGICVNAGLAIIAARELGISDADIRARLQAWQPSASRGRVVSQGKQTFYIDCYNANPASMADALVAFCRSNSARGARCYILGAMNELGAESVQLHWNIGASLQLRAEDRAYFVGPDKLVEAYYGGALQAGAVALQLEVVAEVAEIKSVISQFAGAIFLKGSRSYALEQLLSPELI